MNGAHKRNCGGRVIHATEAHNSVSALIGEFLQLCEIAGSGFGLIYQAVPASEEEFDIFLAAGAICKTTTIDTQQVAF